MATSDSRAGSRRPAKLYFYADRTSAERALQFGEFRLRPTNPGEPLPPDASQILPFGMRPALAPPGFLTLSLSSALSDKLFQRDAQAPCCIVIHNPEEFGERMHRAVQKVLPLWTGIDAAVAYGAPSPLGAAFTKGRHLAAQKEWLFAWRPVQPQSSFNPIVIQIGNLEEFAELREQTGAAFS